MSESLEKRVGNHSLDISNPDKVLFPEAGITKEDLVEYYERIAETMLPHVEDRIVSMHRFPDGIDGKDFYQKDVPDYFPDWIRTVEVEKEDGTLRQLVIDDAATLVYLAGQACLTPHVWLGRVDRRDHPDRMIFDLDPSDDEPEHLEWAARTLRDVLDEVGLVPFLTTSGSRGYHVVVPLDRSADFDTARDFARDVAELLSDRHPERLTTEQRKEERKGRIFVDYLRNAYGQTGVAPYSVRAREGAPVATPIEWDELGRSGMGPRRYTIRNLFRRLSSKEDPWKGIGRRGRSLDGPRERLDRLLDVEGED